MPSRHWIHLAKSQLHGPQDLRRHEVDNRRVLNRCGDSPTSLLNAHLGTFRTDRSGFRRSRRRRLEPVYCGA